MGFGLRLGLCVADWRDAKQQMGLGLATAEETIVDGVTSEVIDRTVVELIGREDRDFVRSRGWDLCGRMVEDKGCS
ncbi:hypothetical protein F0562_024013 [Nyssa sinensis]|uniref:Uncharacterized protein n=1 Tax=Nyssa sinensis TaxID=561372 RepID=A0A5J5BNX7_9ASTE|nr:hypothetical protein F0562_024013 [Nyssa sinensis]